MFHIVDERGGELKWYFVAKSDVNFSVCFIPASCKCYDEHDCTSKKVGAGRDGPCRSHMEEVHELDTVPANMVVRDKRPY